MFRSKMFCLSKIREHETIKIRKNKKRLMYWETIQIFVLSSRVLVNLIEIFFLIHKNLDIKIFVGEKKIKCYFLFTKYMENLIKT